MMSLFCGERERGEERERHLIGVLRVAYGTARQLLPHGRTSGELLFDSLAGLGNGGRMKWKEGFVISRINR